ncbi:MAG TPA: FHA domain-containing protein, partial [Isosphaeraceae bacterium]
DIALIHDAEIRQVDAELQRLIERGHDRIALNLEGVVRLSSQVIAAVLKAHRRCSAAGGAVKICQIHPDLKPIFALTGVFLTIDIHPDLRSALESAWPEPTPRHPSPGTPPGRGDADGIGHPSRMPVAGDDSGPGGSATDPEPAELGIALDEIFAAPSCASGPGEHERIQPEDFDPGAGLPTPAAPPLEGLAPAIPLDLDDLFSPPEPPEPAPEPSPPATPERPEADGADVPAALPGAGTEPRLGTIGHTSESVPPRSRPDVPAPRVRLIVLVGRAKGQAVAIATPRFLIGRDPSCHLRAVSPIVSRFHAVLERRDGRVFLRDLGSSNGTTLGDRRLRAHEEVEVDDGQRLEVGPMRFAVAIETGTSVRPDRPAESAPGHAAAPGALSQDPALRPLLHCPRCGTDGWIAADQLIPQLLQAIARALSPGSPLHVPVPHWHATPAPGASIGARSSSPVPEMHVAGRDGHAAAGARPSSPIARLGPSAGEVAPTTEGVADGRGYEWAGGPAGVAVPHAAHAPGNGSLAPAATPRRPGALPAVGVSASRREHDSPAAPDRPTIEMAVATPEDEVPEFHDGLDLAPPEGPADPAEERPA